MHTVCVVIPLYNEEKNIPRLIAELRLLKSRLHDSLKVVFVDDGSSDNTWDEIKKQQTDDVEVCALRFSRNFGKEAAVAAGLDTADGDAIIVMDGDLQHPPEVIEKMIAIWKEGNVDIVNAIKRQRNKESYIYRYFSFLFYSIISKLSGFSFKGASDFKLIDRKVLDEWKKLGDRTLFFREMSTWLGFKNRIVEFDVGNRTAGKSGWSFLKLSELAFNAIMSVSTVPLQLITSFGIGFLILSLILGTHAVYNKFFGDPIDGITMLILINLLTGSLIMISLGIIGGYLGKIYYEVRKRPRYVVRDRIIQDLSANR